MDQTVQLNIRLDEDIDEYYTNFKELRDQLNDMHSCLLHLTHHRFHY